jgi:hypothetical protein
MPRPNSRPLGTFAVPGRPLSSAMAAKSVPRTRRNEPPDGADLGSGYRRAGPRLLASVARPLGVPRSDIRRRTTPRTGSTG